MGGFVLPFFGAKIVRKIAKNDKKHAKNVKNEKKNALFYENICVIQKKVVSLHQNLKNNPKTTLKNKCYENFYCSKFD